MPAAVSSRPWRKHAVYTLVSAAVTVLVFSYLLRTVTWAEVLELLKESDRNALLMFVCFSLTATIFRTWRYRLLLEPAGCAPGRAALFLTVVVRNLFSDLLPARIGSLVYLLIINARLGVPIGPALSSFTLPFFFDLLALAPLILLAGFWAGGGRMLPPLYFFAGGAGLLFFTAAAVYLLPELLSWLARKMPETGRGGAHGRSSPAELLAGVAKDFRLVRKGGLCLRLLLLSLLVRIGKYGSLYIFLYALLKPLGYGFGQLPIAPVFLGICAAELAASLPISGIAGFGVYEGTWAVVFRLLGFPEYIAKITSIAHHLFTQLYGYGLGLLALLLLMLPFFDWKSSPTPRTESGKRSAAGFYARVTAVLAAALCAAAGACFLPLGGEAERPAGADRPSPAALAAERELYRRLPAEMIFDSNRGGSFDIYRMRSDGSEVKLLIGGPRHEMYPDPSPDGRWIVFARAEKLSRRSPSEIWLSARDGGAPRRLAGDGTFPTFSRDGQRVYFERGRAKVMQVDLDGRNLVEIFPAGSSEFSGYEIVKPRISPNGRFAAFVSDRKGRWNSWYVDLASKQARHIAGGCEPAWFSDSIQVAWVRTEGAKEGSGIYAMDLKQRSTRPLQDAGPPRGHEYFPTLYGRDRYLLFGASRGPGDHEHTSANYQIFIKDLERRETIRLTYDTATDRWPKILPPPESGDSSK